MGGPAVLTFESATIVITPVLVRELEEPQSTRLVEEARRVASDKTAIYFKRHYKDGKARAARVPINAFVGSHIARIAERPAAASAA